ncbi:copper homeostasis protein CutC [Algoriphagus namhaensis]
MKKILLEAPVFNLTAALEAAEYGVNRIELCSNFPEGGETPSPGMLSLLKKEIDLPVFVMIRPRGGDFFYSEKEISIMKTDIQIHRDLGADGFVFGALDNSGYINERACEVLLRAAGDCPCTFHRAFDASRDLSLSLEVLIGLGFSRILTSGGKNTVTEGLSKIQELMKKAGERISIMPGGGSKVEHVIPLAESGYLQEIHASCKEWKKSENEFQNTDLKFSDEPKAFTHYLGLNEQMVKNFLEVLN